MTDLVEQAHGSSQKVNRSINGAMLRVALNPTMRDDSTLSAALEADGYPQAEIGLGISLLRAQIQADEALLSPPSLPETDEPLSVYDYTRPASDLQDVLLRIRVNERPLKRDEITVETAAFTDSLAALEAGLKDDYEARSGIIATKMLLQELKQHPGMEAEQKALLSIIYKNIDSVSAFLESSLQREDIGSVLDCTALLGELVDYASKTNNAFVKEVVSVKLGENLGFLTKVIHLERYRADAFEQLQYVFSYCNTEVSAKALQEIKTSLARNGAFFDMPAKGARGEEIDRLRSDMIRTELKELGIVDIDKMLNAWERSCWNSDYGGGGTNMVENVNRLRELALANPQAIAYLNTECGIQAFGRYPLEVLLIMYNEKDITDKDFMLVCVAEDDMNGTFYKSIELHTEAMSQLKPSHCYRIIETGSSIDGRAKIDALIAKYGRQPDVIEIQAHGDILGAKLGEDYTSGEMHRSKPETWLVRKEHCKESTVVVLNSCDTGHAGALGEKMNQELQVDVVCPAASTWIDSIQVMRDEQGALTGYDVEYANKASKRRYVRAE